MRFNFSYKEGGSIPFEVKDAISGVVKKIDTAKVSVHVEADAMDFFRDLATFSSAV